MSTYSKKLASDTNHVSTGDADDTGYIEEWLQDGVRVAGVKTTGAVESTSTLLATSTSTSALAVGPNGTTNPVLKVDASTASSATGVKVTGAAAASGVALAAISSGAAENLTIDAKGSGTVTVNGTATGGITLARAVTASSTLTAAGLSSSAGVTNTSSTAGSGYATGAGGAVTQASTSATAVSLNKTCGQITTVALTTAAAAEERFTVNNTNVVATDVIVVGTTYNGAGTPMVGVVNITANAFDIVITNLHAANALNAAMVINFAIVKSVAS